MRLFCIKKIICGASVNESCQTVWKVLGGNGNGKFERIWREVKEISESSAILGTVAEFFKLSRCAFFLQHTENFLETGEN